jgi:hypothetical protein
VQVSARMRVVCALAAASWLALAPRPASAGTCALPDLAETMPPDGAQTVPTNAILSARYATTADYLGETVVLQHVGKEDRNVPATWAASEGILSIVPPAPLVTGDEYVVKWPGLRGLNSANLGRGKDVRFRVGAEDKEPPKFAGLGAIEWDVEREKDTCTDAVEDRYVFNVDVGLASDDGGADSLTLLVYQTSGSGPSVSGPTPILVQRVPARGEKLRIVRALDSGVGKVCFSAIVRDLTGKVSSGSGETCVQTVEPPFFYGCAAARTGRGGVVLLGAAIAALATRRLRRRG